MTLRGDNIAAEFKAILDDYVRTRYGTGHVEQPAA